MSMGKSELDRCLESIGRARDRMEYIPRDDLRWVVLRALTHLASHVRNRVADDPSLYPFQLDASIQNLCDRIEALERRPHRNEAGEVGHSWWLQLATDIRDDCTERGWSDLDASVAWMMGRDVLTRARKLGARFPHDPPEPRS